MFIVKVYKEEKLFFTNKFDSIKQNLQENGDLMVIFGLKSGTMMLSDFDNSAYNITVEEEETKEIFLTKNGYYFKEFEITIPQEFFQSAVSLKFKKSIKHI